MHSDSLEAPTSSHPPSSALLFVSSLPYPSQETAKCHSSKWIGSKEDLWEPVGQKHKENNTGFALASEVRVCVGVGGHVLKTEPSSKGSDAICSQIVSQSSRIREHQLLLLWLLAAQGEETHIRCPGHDQEWSWVESAVGATESGGTVFRPLLQYPVKCFLCKEPLPRYPVVH